VAGEREQHHVDGQCIAGEPTHGQGDSSAGALSLVNGVLYIPFGGVYGDGNNPAYRGFVAANQHAEPDDDRRLVYGRDERFRPPSTRIIAPLT